MKNNVLIYERNCWCAQPIFLGVYENIGNAKKILNEANKEYHYYLFLPKKSKTYQRGEQVLTIKYLSDLYKEGDKIVIECEQTSGALEIKRIVKDDNLQKIIIEGNKIKIPDIVG